MERFSFLVLHNLKYAGDRKILATYLLKNNFSLLSGTSFAATHVLNEHKSRYIKVLQDIKLLEFKQMKSTVIINYVEIDPQSLKCVV